jgi:hypothetical protein
MTTSNELELIEKLSNTKGLSVSSLMSIAIPSQYCL